MRIAPNGLQKLITPDVERANSDAASFEDRYVQAQGSLPNGLAFTEKGDFIIANWGTNALEILSRDGRLRTLYTEIDGQPLGKANFPLRDSEGRIWFTVTTREQPWTSRSHQNCRTATLRLIDDHGIRIVAEGFNGTNEIRFDDNEEWLYLVESTGRRISRLRAHPDGSLTDREVYGPSELEGHPDGFAFDSYGNLWVTLIFLDKLIAITPEGEVLTLLDDSNPQANAVYEEHFRAGTLTPEYGCQSRDALPLDGQPDFGGPTCVPSISAACAARPFRIFRARCAGQPMIHWH